MRSCLLATGFDYAQPDPKVAWAAFQNFAVQPLDGTVTVNVGVEIYHAADRDDVLWLEFARTLEDANGTTWHCGCLLSRPVPVELIGVSEEFWWWAEYGPLSEWFEA